MNSIRLLQLRIEAGVCVCAAFRIRDVLADSKFDILGWSTGRTGHPVSAVL